MKAEVAAPRQKLTPGFHLSPSALNSDFSDFPNFSETFCEDISDFTEERMRPLTSLTPPSPTPTDSLLRLRARCYERHAPLQSPEVPWLQKLLYSDQI